MTYVWQFIWHILPISINSAYPFFFCLNLWKPREEEMITSNSYVNGHYFPLEHCNFLTNVLSVSRISHLQFYSPDGSEGELSYTPIWILLLSCLKQASIKTTRLNMVPRPLTGPGFLPPHHQPPPTFPNRSGACAVTSCLEYSFFQPPGCLLILHAQLIIKPLWDHGWETFIKTLLSILKSQPSALMCSNGSLYFLPWHSIHNIVTIYVLEPSPHPTVNSRR